MYIHTLQLKHNRNCLEIFIIKNVDSVYRVQ